MAPALRSFKLRFSDLHVRVVPATGADGCAFCGSGVDLTGAEAQAAFALAGPLLAAVGAGVRTLSVDLERPRLLATCAAGVGAGAPRGVRVVRIDDAQVLGALLAQVAPLLTLLAQTAAAHLAARLAEP